MKKSNKNKGYTLIEMAAVLVIMAILVNIAISNVAKYIKTSKIETNKINCETVADYVSGEHINNGQKTTYDYFTEIKPKVEITKAVFGEYIYNENNELSYYIYIDRGCYVKKAGYPAPKYYEIQEIFCKASLLE
jgi:prepilin-type N-terminal cleavage/methylation domain-containing protein